MTIPENLLGPRKRRVSLLEMEPPDGTAPSDDEGNLAGTDEEDSDDGEHDD